MNQNGYISKLDGENWQVWISIITFQKSFIANTVGSIVRLSRKMKLSYFEEELLKLLSISLR